MTDQHFVQELQAFIDNCGSAVDGALIVSCIVNPATDVRWCREQLATIASRVAEPTPQALADCLHAEGFAGATTYYKAENSALGYVLANREGIPISLGMVLLGVAECLGLPAHGVNFPNHFLVSVAGRLIDPFTMTLVEEEECRNWLQMQHLPAEQALQEASPAAVVERMLNNLGQLASNHDDKARALELSDYKLVLAQHPFPVYLERVDLWLGLGVTEMARLDLQAALALAPDASSRSLLQDKLAAISAQPSRLH